MLRLGILVSGNGSNLRAIAQACNDAMLSAEVAVVIASHADCKAVQWAQQQGMQTACLHTDADIVACLTSYQVDWVVLAGYLRKIGPQSLHAFPDRIVNIHPSLLPKYGGYGMYGQHVHKAVLEAGEHETGTTVHLVNEHYDTGKVLAQKSVPVRHDDTPETLAKRVQQVEHRLYVAILQKIANNGSDKLLTLELDDKAQRREARLSRRQIDRKASCLRRIAYLAPLLGLDRHSIPRRPGNGFSALRARAAREQVSLPELFNIMLRLAQKHGYKGKFKLKTEKESGVVEAGANTLHTEMAKLATQRGLAAVTLGEYLHYRISEQNLPGRLKIDQTGGDNLYALRNMLEEEFAQVWSTQAKYHPLLNGTHQGKPIQEHFQAAIFFNAH